MSKTEEVTPPVAARDGAASPRIGDRYRIEKEIGRGGMGRVFVARELIGVFAVQDEIARAVVADLSSTRPL